jgi:hypothetical protein
VFVVRSGSSAQVQSPPAGPGGLTGRNPPGPLLGRLSAAAVATAILLMMAALLVRNSWMTPALPMPAGGPPWESSVHVPPVAAVSAIWLAAGLGGAGIAAGLVAVRRGAPVPVRLLLIAAAIGVVALIVLPPAGSTDALYYAAFGHIAAAGHNPYVMSPAQFGREHFLPGVPRNWQNWTSVYGPLATAEQYVAARLGPGSLAATVFWLKLANAGAFAAIAIAANRLLRADRASRIRAHLLWTANPLLLWTLIAAGHLEVLAAAAGLAGLLISDRWLTARPVARALAAGACIGVAVDIHVTFVVFGLALAWSVRRQPAQLLAAAGGAALVLVPSFALAGPAAVTSVLHAPGGRGIYALLMRDVSFLSGHVLPVAGCLAVGAAALALWRLPAGFQHAPAVRAALALSLGWLLVWPLQYPWYAVMVVCVLIFYPASRLDWLVLAWLTMSTVTDMPGRGLGGPGDALGTVIPALHNASYLAVQPLVVAGVLVGVAILCRTGHWNADPSGGGSGSRATMLSGVR